MRTGARHADGRLGGLWNRHVLKRNNRGLWPRWFYSKLNRNKPNKIDRYYFENIFMENVFHQQGSNSHPDGLRHSLPELQKLTESKSVIPNFRNSERNSESHVSGDRLYKQLAKNCGIQGNSTEKKNIDNFNFLILSLFLRYFLENSEIEISSTSSTSCSRRCVTPSRITCPSASTSCAPAPCPPSS